MSKDKNKTTTINVQGTAISIISQRDDDYICITDMARYKDSERSDYIIQNWLRNRNTLEFLGVWEQLHNPEFNSIEFDGIKNQAGLNSFTLTAKKWKEATIEQLLVLANIESMNAEFIRMGLSQAERLKKLNAIAISQLQSLLGHSSVKKLS